MIRHRRRNPSLRYPFIMAAILWGIASSVLCWKFSPNSVSVKRSLSEFAIFSTLCLLDLFALSKVFYGLFQLLNRTQPSTPGADLGTTENSTLLVIRTSYWGAIKIVSLIFLGVLLERQSSQAVIPVVGILTGISTLLVVPLIGGLLWHFQEKGLSADERTRL